MTAKATVEFEWQYNARVLENVIRFLKENEQYGDEWDSEIKVLEKLRTHNVR